MKSYFCFNRIFAGVVILLLMATLFFACSKSATDTANVDTNKGDNQAITAAADQAVVSGIYDDLFGIALEVGADASLNETGRKAHRAEMAAKLGSCFSYDIDDVTQDQWPKTLLIKFGAGCADNTGRVRAGNIQVVYSGYFYYPGSVIVIKPLTYKVNGVTVTGTKTITNMSTNSVYKYSSVVTGGTVQLDTVMVGFNSNTIITQTAGTATMGDVTDDIFSITGTDSLTYPMGIAASITVNEADALERKLECPWIGKGKALVTVKGVTATVNYGNGICDDSATIDLGDKIKSIALPK
ncbi:hypothetical protein L3C95_01020 [Chitinophaga filiformis]|uniref:hypothetical protein n=1 Tax=Chitinophaga filiformis TaxID=104663 RepID=UPI001F202A0E|nr:hypothetical protein [Chitinophaga filiformis]MCF6401433.1 hypothetical protein [Chitinophaga filiformis]